MPVDGEVRAAVTLASRRHGVVSSAELAEAGLGRHAVAHRVAVGWLRRMFRGVYLVGPLETPHSRAMAATLAVGEGAVVSHYSAAVLWALRPPREGQIDVTVPGRKTRGRPGIRVHRSRLHPHDAAHQHEVPVTSPARTLLDLAATLPQRDLDRAVEEAQVQRRVTRRSLDEQFRRYPGHRGSAALRKAIRTDTAFTRSEAERRAIELIRAARLPSPEANARIHGYEVDFLWRDRHLVVEVDGYAFHSSRSAFERDRRRDRDLHAQGYRVIRLTWHQLTEEPEAVIAAVATALAA